MSGTSADRDWLRQCLRASLEALSLPGQFALMRVPDGTCRPDELAVNFDNFYTAFRGNFGAELTEEQLKALVLVDRLLTAMSEPGNASIWTDDAVIDSLQWHAVRSAAKAALQQLGWDALVA